MIKVFGMFILSALDRLRRGLIALLETGCTIPIMLIVILFYIMTDVNAATPGKPLRFSKGKSKSYKAR